MIRRKFNSIFFVATMAVLVEYLTLLSDKIIVGQMLGAKALSAITLVEPVFSVSLFFSCLIAIGGSLVVHYARSEEENKQAAQFFSQALIVGILCGILLTILYHVAQGPLLRLAVGSSNAFAHEYYAYLKFHPIAQIVNMLLYSVILYQGGEAQCNASTIVMLVTNVLLSILLGQTMGMGGVALATVLASTLSMIPLIAFFFTKKGKVHLSFYFNPRVLWDMAISGIGGSVIYLFTALMQLAMNQFLLWQFRDDSLVIFTGVINLIALFSTMLDGVVEFLNSTLNMYRAEGNVVGLHRCIHLARRVSADGAALAGRGHCAAHLRRDRWCARGGAGDRRADLCVCGVLFQPPAHVLQLLLQPGLRSSFAAFDVFAKPRLLRAVWHPWRTGGRASRCLGRLFALPNCAAPCHPLCHSDAQPLAQLRAPFGAGGGQKPVDVGRCDDEGGDYGARLPCGARAGGAARPPRDHQPRHARH